MADFVRICGQVAGRAALLERAQAAAGSGRSPFPSRDAVGPPAFVYSAATMHGGYAGFHEAGRGIASGQAQREEGQSDHGGVRDLAARPAEDLLAHDDAEAEAACQPT